MTDEETATQKLRSSFKAAVQDHVPTSRRSGREAGGASSSCSFHVTFTPKRCWGRHSTWTVESSQTGMETGVP